MPRKCEIVTVATAHQAEREIEKRINLGWFLANIRPWGDGSDVETISDEYFSFDGRKK